MQVKYRDDTVPAGYLELGNGIELGADFRQLAADLGSVGARWINAGRN